MSQWPKWLRRKYGELEICGSRPGYDTNFSLKLIINSIFFFTFTGTIRKGAFDGYFGDISRDVPNPPYNLTSVVQSLVGRAIVAASSSVYINPTRSHQIPFIRSTATIRCPTNFTYGIPACKNNELCLYDIDSDPCESNNLASSQPNVAQHLRTLLLTHRRTLIKQSNLAPDVYGADPKRWNNTWSSWVHDGCALHEDLDAYLNVCDRTKPV